MIHSDSVIEAYSTRLTFTAICWPNVVFQLTILLSSKHILKAWCFPVLHYMLHYCCLGRYIVTFYFLHLLGFYISLYLIMFLYIFGGSKAHLNVWMFLQAEAGEVKQELERSYSQDITLPTSIVYSDIDTLAHPSVSPHTGKTYMQLYIKELLWSNKASLQWYCFLPAVLILFLWARCLFIGGKILF